MVTAFDLRASRIAIGGGGDAESAPIDDHFDGLSVAWEGWRQRLVRTVAEAQSGWGRRRADPSACAC